jgi:hypothetical protein
VIPRNVEFVDGSAFEPIPLKSVLIESGNGHFGIHEDHIRVA